MAPIFGPGCGQLTCANCVRGAPNRVLRRLSRSARSGRFGDPSLVGRGSSHSFVGPQKDPPKGVPLGAKLRPKTASPNGVPSQATESGLSGDALSKGAQMRVRAAAQTAAQRFLGGARKILGRCPKILGRTLGRLWAGFGQAFGRACGQTLGRLWADFGQTLGRLWAGSWAGLQAGLRAAFRQALRQTSAKDQGKSLGRVWARISGAFHARVVGVFSNQFQRGGLGMPFSLCNAQPLGPNTQLQASILQASIGSGKPRKRGPEPARVCQSQPEPVALGACQTQKLPVVACFDVLVGHCKSCMASPTPHLEMVSRTTPKTASSVILALEANVIRIAQFPSSRGRHRYVW